MVKKKVYICDHMTENPKTLEAGKTYIAVLAYRKNTHEESQKEIPEELHHSNCSDNNSVR